MHLDVQGDAKPRLPSPQRQRLPKNRHLDRISHDLTSPGQRRLVTFAIANLSYFLVGIACIQHWNVGTRSRCGLVNDFA